MKLAYFPRLAWTGIRKNRKLYLPYILSCMGMIFMFYIIHSLSYSPVLSEMAGGSTLGLVLSLGRFVVAVFSLVFLLYTNSFLIRRRYKEFGLYNILGMDKRGISRIVAWESLMVAGISLLGGLALGIAFSKLAELGLLNVIRAEIDYRFTLSGKAILFTLAMYAGIFLLLLVKSLLQVRRARPLELLRSENSGEKPPKGNRIIAVLGVLILAAAYYMAVSIQSPLTALTIFFVAVLMVIVATYLLFISGSVSLCKALQKNKRYYYKKNHFVSVSSMAYRMKRNGAGLASICILSTMVLVMLASSASLFLGAEDSLRSQYPMDNQITWFPTTIEQLEEENLAPIRHDCEAVFDAHGVTPTQLTEYAYAGIVAQMNGDTFQPDPDETTFNPGTYESLRELYFITQTEYSRLMGTTVHLNPGEAKYYTNQCSYDKNTFRCVGLTLTLTGTVEAIPNLDLSNANVLPSIVLVVPDYETLRPLQALSSQTDSTGVRMLQLCWYFGYNMDDDEDTQQAVISDHVDIFHNLRENNDELRYSLDILENNRSDFYATFGGLFFVGIALSVLFIFAAAMIIYYKQVSEGYEDQSRFAIMQKVGMTREDIKKSINSQVLTVFFAPLLLAILHLAFAFPLVWKLLQLFNLHNLPLVVWTHVGACIVFALIYAVIYKITAGAYYKIVSDSGRE